MGRRPRKGFGKPEKIKKISQQIEKLQKELHKLEQENAKEKEILSVSEQIFKLCTEKQLIPESVSLDIIVDSVKAITQNRTTTESENTNSGSEIEKSIPGICKTSRGKYRSRIYLKNTDSKKHQAIEIGEYKLISEAIASQRAAQKTALKLGFDVRPIIKNKTDRPIQILDVEKLSRLDAKQVGTKLIKASPDELREFARTSLQPKAKWSLIYKGQNRSDRSCIEIIQQVKSELLKSNADLLSEGETRRLVETDYGILGVVFTTEKAQQNPAQLQLIVFGRFNDFGQAESWKKTPLDKNIYKNLTILEAKYGNS